MSSIRVEIFNGLYDNDTVYRNVLTYISKKYATGGYGYYPYDIDSIIRDFELSKEFSLQTSSRNLWHFCVSFSTDFNHKINDQILLTIANNIAIKFCQDYQIYYALDKGTDNLHLHFAVNAYSYHPATEILSSDKMQIYLLKILSYLHSLYPDAKTIKKFPEEVA